MKSQIRICFIATIHRTLNAFVLKTAQYIHENTDWDISFICAYDQNWADGLPEYFHYFPVDMNRGLSFSFKTERQIHTILKREQFDLVQFCTPNASLYTALAAAKTKVPVRLYCQWGIAYVGFSGWKRRIFKLVEKYVCRRATVIEPDSNSNLHFAIAEGLYKKEKGRVIWNGSACGIDLNKYDISNREKYRQKIREESGIPKESFVFGFVGRINKDKGIAELFGAFKKMQETCKDIYLILVGRDERSDDADNNLNQWADKNDRIIFVGFSDKVEQYMSAMDCYVLPSYREGFGLSVVEAEAMGLPVIVTDIPGPIDAMIEGKTGLVVPKKDTEALYAAMTDLYENEVKCTAYGNAGPAFVKENFEQQELFRRILENRKELLDQAVNR